MFLWPAWKKACSLIPGSLLDPKELEEERRLAYVGITRAKKESICFGRCLGIFSDPSGSTFLAFFGRYSGGTDWRFKNYLKLSFSLPTLARVGNSSKLSFDNFKDGQRVSHKVFGEGVVISTKKDIVTVAFMKAE